MTRPQARAVLCTTLVLSILAMVGAMVRNDLAPVLVAFAAAIISALAVWRMDRKEESR